MSKEKSLPNRIAALLTPTSGVPVIKSADEILSALNEGAPKEQELTIERLRPRLSEMKRSGILEKVEGASDNGTRSVAGWKLYA